ncbi:MAG: ABC transporter permease [Pseudanabaenaceae cyanobacterium]
MRERSPWQVWGWGITTGFAVAALIFPLAQRMGWVADPTAFLDYPIEAPPSWTHWFGTDRQGHDILARCWGAIGVAWQVVLAATAIALPVAVPLGLWAGNRGGWWDRGLTLAMDSLYALPGLLLSIAIAFAVGTGVWNAAIALSVIYIPQYFRVVRNQTLSVRNEGYVEAARIVGLPPWVILTRYIAPNVWPNVPVLLAFNAADAVLTLAGLGFLGLGVPPEVPEWGHDLKQALDTIATGEPLWWTAFFPGLTMVLMVLGLSLAVEGDRLPPK